MTEKKLLPISTLRNHGLRLLVAAALAAALPKAAQAQAPVVVFLGQIIEVPYSFCPVGYLDTAGQVLPIAGSQQYFNLYVLFGTTYGGDGQTTFGLPYIPPHTLRDGTTIRSCIAVQGTVPTHP